MGDLKPCPFCGGEDIEEDWGSTSDCSKGMYQVGWIECNSCKSSVEHEVNDENMEWDIGGAMLRNKWNNRAQPTIVDYLEANKEMIEKTKCKVVTIESLRKFGGKL